MSSIYRKSMVALCMAALIGVFAGTAAAEKIYMYDFDQNVGDSLVVNQPLQGQDGWYNPSSATVSEYVRTDESGFTGQYTEKSTGYGYLVRDNDTDWYFDIQDNLNFEFSVKMRSSGTSLRTIVGLHDASTDFRTLNVYVYNGELRWRMDDGGEEIFYHKLALPNTDARIYQLGIEATANSADNYSFQCYYEDITSGTGSGKQHYGGQVNATISNISTKWDGLWIETSGGTSRVDDIVISRAEVPEPSTFALLAGGLIGLLAYAWKKRK